MTQRMRTFATAIALLLLAGCAGSGAGSRTTSSPTSSGRPSSTARLAITDPQAGATVQGPTIHMTFSLKGAVIVPFTSTNLKPNQGHLHVLLDGRLITMTSALEQDLRDVQPGQHVVRAEFVANDHAPFSPRVVSTVTFTVR